MAVRQANQVDASEILQLLLAVLPRWIFQPRIDQHDLPGWCDELETSMSVISELSRHNGTNAKGDSRRTISSRVSLL